MKTQLLSKTTFLFSLLFIGFSGHSQKASKVDLPPSYDFDYIYQIKMMHKKGDMIMDYYLKKGEDYVGFDSAEIAKSNPEAKMFMVMDNGLGVTAMFMEMMGRKMVQKSNLRTSDFASEEDMSDYKFTQIDSKTINGYECEGYVTENDKMKMTFYITDDVPVSFNQVFGTNTRNLPKGFNPAVLKKYADNGLMMEMIFEDKKKSKNNMTMQCTKVEETDFSIDTSDYGSMMGALGGRN